jgi:metal-sulfur cluster biosynthetic enzyme
MLTEATILDLLKACYDLGNPFGKPANLVELGCVNELVLTPDRDAPGAGITGVPPRFQLRLTIAPTTADEDARAQLRAQVVNALAGVEQLSRTTLVLAEGWTPARITAEGRQRLKPDAAPFAILNNRR